MSTLYGIKACDTMKKARTWLDEQQVDYTFHDYKKSGIDEATLRHWLTMVPWDQLINRRGTTWRNLPEAQKQNIDIDKAVEIMLHNTSIIKRPVLAHKGQIYLGFKVDTYAQIFN